MNKNEELLLGAFLHDIGKFVFKTGEAGDHIQMGSAFAKDLCSYFDITKDSTQTITSLVGRQYNELDNPEMGECIKDADQILSLAGSDKNIPTVWPLLSVFSFIDVDKGNPSENVYYFDPSPIDYEKNFFPIEEKKSLNTWAPEMGSITDLHNTSWNIFTAEARMLPNKDFWSFFDSLFFLLEKFTGRVSAGFDKSMADISLFDHMKNKAALAFCLFKSNQAEEPFLLIEGKVSGIQDFIYNVASPNEVRKNRAKLLRGRSFYISLLCDSIAMWLLKELDLHRTNLLLTAGGHFMILAPNTSKNNEVLNDAKKKINKEIFFNMFRCNLSLVLEWVTISQNGLKNFPNCLDKLGHKISEAREKRLFDLILDEGLGPFEYDSEKFDVCPICQLDYPKGENACNACKNHVEIGRSLPRTNYLISWFSTENNFFNAIPFPPLGMTWVMVNDKFGVHEILQKLEQKRVFRLQIIDLKSRNIFRDLNPDVNRMNQTCASYGFNFMGNYAPLDTDGSVLEFEELAKKSDGYPMLGVLRMDVDDLGSVVSMGLKHENVISRFTNLSRQVSEFFGLYMNVLAERYSAYITYSGGDDLFVLGPWTGIIALAQNIREDFKKYTCNNPNLTLSGGIVLSKDSTPVTLNARRSGEEEDMAKALKGKNALALFGIAKKWSRIHELMDYAEKMLPLVMGKGGEQAEIPRSFVRFLLDLQRYRYDRHGNERLQWVHEIMPRLHYLIARRGVNHKEINNPKLERAEILAPLLYETELLKDITIPASWVLLKTRK